MTEAEQKKFEKQERWDLLKQKFEEVLTDWVADEVADMFDSDFIVDNDVTDKEFEKLTKLSYKVRIE